MDIIKPMLAKKAEFPQNEQDYGFEIKWDGMRAILYWQNGNLKVLSRNDRDITFQYPELQGMASLSQDSFVLDGEIVYFNQESKPSFAGLQHRMNLKAERSIALRAKEYPIVYIIFDLLFLQDKLTLELSYMNRRKLLEEMNLDGPAWQTPAYKIGSGTELLAVVQKMGLEGIVAKRLNSPYAPNMRNGDWLKIKIKQQQEFVIGGWFAGVGSRSNTIGSLLLGYYDNKQLIYAGKVGTGFTEKMLQDLAKALSSLTIAKSPFCGEIPHESASFVQPILVCEVEFAEWSNGVLRHPSFKGLRADKLAVDVVRE